MKTKKTIFINGIGKEENRESLINAFSTFGDIIDIQISTTSADNWENPNGMFTSGPDGTHWLR